LLTIIASNAPKGAQVILAHEENPDVFKADRIYELSDDKRLLNAADFERLSPQMFFYVEQVRNALAGIRIVVDDEEVDVAESEPD
jgi:hypothetical protein